MATRHQLVAAAAAIFDQRGFDGASLGDIEAGTGLSKGALYFHFQSKEELADAVVQRQHEISLAAVEAIAATHASALEQIVMLCHEMGRQIVQDPIVRAGIRLTLEASAGGRPPGSPGPYQDWIEACRQLAETAITEGDLPGTVDAPELARFVISAFTGVQMVSNVSIDGSISSSGSIRCGGSCFRASWFLPVAVNASASGKPAGIVHRPRPDSSAGLRDSGSPTRRRPHCGAAAGNPTAGERTRIDHGPGSSTSDPGRSPAGRTGYSM